MAKWAEHALLQLSFLYERENGRTLHKNDLICQKCAINCGIEGNASNESITKYKNLSGVQSISHSVQWLARYRIVALISIGRLCIAFCSDFCARIENYMNPVSYTHLTLPTSR